MRKKSVTGLVNGVTNITSFRQHPQRMNRNQREYHINIRHFEKKKKGKHIFFFSRRFSTVCNSVCVCEREYGFLWVWGWVFTISGNWILFFFGTRHSHVENVEGANGKELGFFVVENWHVLKWTFSEKQEWESRRWTANMETTKKTCQEREMLCAGRWRTSIKSPKWVLSSSRGTDQPHTIL